MANENDHKEVAALQMADQLDNLITEKSIYRFLTVYAGWSETDAKEIIARAKQIYERRKK